MPNGRPKLGSGASKNIGMAKRKGDIQAKIFLNRVILTLQIFSLFHALSILYFILRFNCQKEDLMWGMKI